jgi:hypothetical protein
VVDAFVAGAVEADVVGGPSGAEVLAGSEELADQLRAIAVLDRGVCDVEPLEAEPIR